MIRAVQMDNFRGLLGIRRMDSLECTDNGVLQNDEKVDERINEGILRWLCHVEEKESDRIAKRFYVGDCAGNRLVGRPGR